MLPIILSASLLSCSDVMHLIERVERTNSVDDKVREELIYELKNVAPKDCFNRG